MRYVFYLSVVFISLGSVMGLHAQSQSLEPGAGVRGASAPAVQAAWPAVTVTGCVRREAEVPGRVPNPVERLGVLEDYILTDTKIINGSLTGTPRSMYQIKDIDRDKLKALVGRVVQITGTMEDLDESARDREGTMRNVDLPDIRGAAIRQIAAECTAAR